MREEVTLWRDDIREVESVLGRMNLATVLYCCID